jgi:hypothetical protein
MRKGVKDNLVTEPAKGGKKYKPKSKKIRLIRKEKRENHIEANHIEANHIEANHIGEKLKRIDANDY